MPQKYVVELPDGGKYEIEEPQATSVREQVGGFVKDIASGLSNHPAETLKGGLEGAVEGTKRFAKKLGGNVLGLGQMVLTPPHEQAAELGKQLALGGMPSGKEAVRMATGVDLSGGSPEIGADLATAVLLGGMGGKKFGKSGFGRKAPPLVRPVEGVPSPNPVTTTETIPIAKGPLQTAPAGSRFTLGREVDVKPQAKVTGTGSQATGMRQTMSTPPPPNEIKMSLPMDEQVAANAAMKAAAAEDLAKTGKPSYTGAERRGPNRIQSEVEDAAYKTVRESQERKAAKDRAKGTLARPAEKPKAEAPAPKEPSTDSLTAMREKYGPEKAAEMAGMKDVVELDAWIEAGPGKGRAERAAEIYSRKRGAEKTNRVFGTDLPSTKKIPSEAVTRIKAAAEAEIAKDGKVSPATQKLLDRIKSEGGSASIRALFVGGGAATGAALGKAVPAKNDSEKIGNALAGGVAGAAAGFLPGNLSAAARKALKLRTEGFLTGGAIPKNILTAAGAPATIAAEGGGLGAAKEMLRLPTNAKEFWSAMKNPATANKYGDTAGPLSKTIGAIDHSATQALKRAGVPDEKIAELLLTGNSSLFKGAVVHPLLEDNLQAGLKIAYPFQRVPMNVFNETMARGGRIVGAKMGPKGLEFALPKGAELWKTALDLASAGGGYALGEWAEKDPAKVYLANVAMAALGPRAGLGTLGMVGKLGRQAVGGISPIPEQSADLKSFVGFPFAPLPFWKAMQKLGIVKKDR